MTAERRLGVDDPIDGVKPVRAQWQVPAMVIDATLPAVPMLQAYPPQVEVAEPVEDDQRAASLLRLFT